MRAAADRRSVASAPGVLIPRGAGRRPVLAAPAPVRGPALDVLPGARLLLSLIDLEASHRPRESLLRQLFGLSVTEARVAQDLAEGHTADEIAERVHLRRSTVRQVIKSILAKTDTHRQAQLAALLARIPERLL